MIAVLGGLADVERDLIRTRTAEGRQPGQGAWAAHGPSPKLTPQQQKEQRRRRAEGATLRSSPKATTSARRRFRGCGLRENSNHLFIMGWHLTPRSSVLLHNAFLAQGCWCSMGSFAANARATPDLCRPTKHSTVSPVRRNCGNRFGSTEHQTGLRGLELSLCSRMRTRPELTRQKWFSSEERVAVRAVAFPPPLASVHRADAGWLSRPEAEWEDAAIHYWRGTASQAPLFELMVQGKIYFPDWQNPPFGLLAPSLPALGSAPIA